MNKINTKKTIGFTLALLLSCICFEVMALTRDGTYAPLDEALNTSSQLMNTVCYVIALASAGVGAYRFTQTQQLSSAAVSGTISILVTKFPAWVAATAIV